MCHKLSHHKAVPELEAVHCLIYWNADYIVLKCFITLLSLFLVLIDKKVKYKINKI